MPDSRHATSAVSTPTLVRRLAGALALAVAALLPAAAAAQEYPSRPIRMLVGYSPGGGVDALARTLSARLSDALGQNVVVENRPGATSTIAANVLSASQPDGYTVFLADSALLIAARAMQNLTFDPMKSFAPVAGIATAPLAIAVAASSPLRSLEDMARASKSEQLNYATSGIGTVHHLAVEHLMSRADIRMTHLPYRGASQLLPDLISGQVPVAVLSAAAAMGQVQAGKIRVLGLTSPDKLEGAADWRAIADWLPGFDASPRLFLLAPSGTPQQVVARLETEIDKALNDAALAQNLSKQGFITAYRPATQLRAAMEEELERWTALIQKSGIVLK
ncbi:MAG: tripartite tricarboxylate transporter substrate binding protein [Lautropia sp.]|nr:tripartite tricarboxylate transporter substrate binding protein [Lautropia sp.]